MDKHCTDEILMELNDISESVQQIISQTVDKLEDCYGNATLLLPATTPYLPEIAKCTTVVAN